MLPGFKRSDLRFWDVVFFKGNYYIAPTMGVTSITGMAITDRSHMHEYITPAIIDRRAAYKQVRSLTAISLFHLGS